MANILVTNAKRQALVRKEEEKARKIDETHQTRAKTIAKRAQELNKVLKEKQRIVAIDRKKHIKESLKAYQERIKKSRSVERSPESPTKVVRLDREFKEKVEKIQLREKGETQDLANRLEAYFMDYKAETEHARKLREATIESQTGSIRIRLTKTAEVQVRAKLGATTFADTVSDQLIKKLIKHEETLKQANTKKTRHIDEEKKKLSETITDKKRKVRTAFKTKQKHVEELYAEDQTKAQRMEENIRKQREEKLARLAEENKKWKDYFLRALEISESNVS